MTVPSPRDGGRSDTMVALSGVAREVETLRRRLDRTEQRTRQLADAVTDLASDVAAAAAAPRSAAAVSWLRGQAPSPEAAKEVLDELVQWVSSVFLRYGDARRALPECWLWHPDIVEELLWLMQVWDGAYDPAVSSTAYPAADWHDRYRPGVVRRLGALAKNCSLENHAHDGVVDEPAAPATDSAAVELIAEWWGSDNRRAAPSPAPQHLGSTSVLDGGWSS